MKIGLKYYIDDGWMKWREASGDLSDNKMMPIADDIET